MPVSYWERERAHRVRLLVAVPISAIIVVFLFLFSDRLSLSEIEKAIGWKGELRLLPEVTILPDTDPFSSPEEQSELSAMSSLDLDLADAPDLIEPRKVEQDQPNEEEPLDIPQDDLLNVPSIPKKTEIPYSDTYVILKMIEPEYPPPELAAGVEGNVTVELFVNDQGRVEQATVLSAIGPRSFQESSLRAVRQFLFQPPIENGRPTPMRIKFLIKFRIYG